MLKSRLPQIAAALPALVDEGVEQTAEHVAQYARVRVPVDEGDLRDAIHVERQARAAHRVVAGDTDAFYGHMVEHGTTRLPPRPFLVPAVDDASLDVRPIFTVLLRGL